MSMKPAELIFTCLLALLLVSPCVTQDDLFCADGWTLVGTNCFKAFDDKRLSFVFAREGCDIYDAVLAYASNEDELNFLTKAVQKRNEYAWWTGVRDRAIYDGVERKSKLQVQVMDYSGKWIPKDNITTDVLSPPIQKPDNENFKCIAFRPLSEGTFSREPCRVALPYVCSGKPESAKKADYSSLNWNITNGVAFYFSPINDRLTYDEAKKICGMKGLSLMPTTQENLDKFIAYATYLEHWKTQGSEAWWCDASPSKQNLKWYSAGAKINTKYYTIKASGKSEKITSSRISSETFPYFCKRSSLSTKTNFGCPKSWIRGGQSCYYTSGVRILSQSDAQKECARHGSHLLTVNSIDEKLWLESADILQSVLGYWTSLNDQATKNSLVWHDGSKLDQKLIRWTTPLGDSMGLHGHFNKLADIGDLCAFYRPKSNELIGRACSDANSPGCQYQLKAAGDSCIPGWEKLKDRCYYTQNIPKQVLWTQNLGACYSLLENVDQEITPGYIDINEVEILNFLKEKMDKGFWVGLNSVSIPGILQWTDGTLPDFDLFAKSRDEKNDGVDKKCVAIGTGGYYARSSCDRERRYFCEKEIKLAMSSKDGNNRSTQCAASVILLLLSFGLSRFWRKIK